MMMNHSEPSLRALIEAGQRVLQSPEDEADWLDFSQRWEQIKRADKPSADAPEQNEGDSLDG